MNHKTNSKRELVRVGKNLKELITLHDNDGNVIHKSLRPTMVEIYPGDIMQLIVGATLLSIPIAFTEEVWKLGYSLPWINIILIALVSIFFMALFVYYNFYRYHFEQHRSEFIKRVVLIYIVSLGVSFLLLVLIGYNPAVYDVSIIIKQMILISFPASMSAAVADLLK